MTYQWGELRYPVGRSFAFSISLLLIVLPLHKHSCPKIKLQIHIIISHFPQDISYPPPSFQGLHPENLRNFCHTIKTPLPHLGSEEAVPPLNQTKIEWARPQLLCSCCPSFTRDTGQYYLWDSAQKTAGTPRELLLTVIRT